MRITLHDKFTISFLAFIGNALFGSATRRNATSCSTIGQWRIGIYGSKKVPSLLFICVFLASEISQQTILHNNNRKDENDVSCVRETAKMLKPAAQVKP
jgi:hypothetical protein